MNSSIHDKEIFCMTYENITTTNCEPNEWIIFVQSTKIGTHENKATVMKL